MRHWIFKAELLVMYAFRKEVYHVHVVEKELRTTGRPVVDLLFDLKEDRTKVGHIERERIYPVLIRERLKHGCCFDRHEKRVETFNATAYRWAASWSSKRRQRDFVRYTSKRTVRVRFPEGEMGQLTGQRAHFVGG